MGESACSELRGIVSFPFLDWRPSRPPAILPPEMKKELYHPGNSWSRPPLLTGPIVPSGAASVHLIEGMGSARRLASDPLGLHLDDLPSYGGHQLHGFAEGLNTKGGADLLRDPDIEMPEELASDMGPGRRAAAGAFSSRWVWE